MLARIFALLPFALLASASHLTARDNVCSTGSQKCCNSVLSQKQAFTHFGASVLDILDGLDGQVGLNCLPVVGNACSQQTVCCQNDHFNGLINVGCNAISL